MCSDAADGAASRLGLVPLAPGGSLLSPPAYSAQELSQISFGVYLDPQLRGGDAEAYLQERAQVCLAEFGVQLFVGDVESGSSLLSSMLSQDASGMIRLAAENLTSGTVYGWRVVAALPDGSTVYSMPLYFSVTTGGPEADDFAMVTALLRQLTIEQRREAVALDAILSGRLVYETYPTASDSYVCAAIGKVEAAPLPAQLRAWQLPSQIIPLLGLLMQSAEVVQTELRDGEDATALLDELTAQLAQLTGSVSYGKVITSRAPNIAATLARITAAKNDPEQLVALLSELRLALDSAVGFGSINLRQGYEEAFRAYAEMGEERLSRIVAFQPYFTSLYGAEEAAVLTTLIDDQRAALALLRDEVQRGRLSKQQLGQRVRANSQRAGQASFRVYHHIDGATCSAMPNEKASPQVQQEMLHCELARLVTSVWPD